MKHRVCVIAVIQNDKDEYLICKKPRGLGVYPGQYALVGGGIDEGERMDAALHREVMEEVGLTVVDLEPLYFRDTVATKHYADGSQQELYMIYLYFACKVEGEVKLGEEFEKYAWVKPENLLEYDLNEATKLTFKKLGVL